MPAYSLPINLTHTSYFFRLWSDNPQSVASPLPYSVMVWTFSDWLWECPVIFLRESELSLQSGGAEGSYESKASKIPMIQVWHCTKAQYIIFQVATPTDSYPHDSLWTGFPAGTCLLKLTNNPLKPQYFSTKTMPSSEWLTLMCLCFPKMSSVLRSTALELVQLF